MQQALAITHLNKHFESGKHALRDVTFSVQPGEFVALIGASGSGKSTLLRHIAGLVSADKLSTSRIEVNGHCVQSHGQIHKHIRVIRSQIGFVFQQFNLVDRLPVMTNVLVGMLHRVPTWRSWFRIFTPQERTLAVEALDRVGMADCYAQRASTLSGGQQQRAAIARTLVQQAKVVLADEPIASLDPESSRKVMDILAKINREDGCTVLVSLHQVDIAIKYCARVIALRQGEVVYDGPSASLNVRMIRELYGTLADELIPSVNIATLLSTSTAELGAVQTSALADPPQTVKQAQTA
jgi:phosphonate transport system ATP-binding protein